jgi:hypothetical protein
MALLEVDHAQGSGTALCRCGPRYHPLIGNVESSQKRGVVSHLCASLIVLEWRQLELSPETEIFGES